MFKKSILIVDDDRMLRRLIHDRLKMLGQFDCREAADCFEALRQIQLKPPQLIILDYMLGELKGTDILKQLAAQNIQIPVILITAYDSVEMRREVANLPVEVIIQKPVELNNLIELIRQIILNKSTNNHYI